MKKPGSQWVRGSLLLASASLSGCSLLGDLFSSPGLAGPERPPLSIEASYPLLERAREAYASGYYGNAIDLLEQELAQRPASLAALNGLGASYDKLGRFEIARRYYFRALTLVPDSVLTLSNLGYSYLLQGAIRDALPYLKLALELEPANAMAAGNLKLARSMVLEGKPVQEALASRDLVPADAALRISNGNGIRHAARAVGHWLEARQITVSAIGDATHHRFPRTVLRYRLGFELAAEQLARRMDWASVLLQESALAPGLDMELVLGRDFDTWANALVAQLQTAEAAATPVQAAIEIANGNGITGSAARLRDLLARRGTTVARLTNADSFSYPRSVLYYRSGRSAAAEALRTQIGAAGITLTETEDLDPRIDLRLVLGQDLVYPQQAEWPLLLSAAF